jgi:polyphosphate kinase 2 (PPK2 family)
MDTAGKDSAVKHVFSGVNPAGCNVKSFKKPSSQESSHHFLWRINKECPAKGMIKIFNRSQFEDILVPMINDELSKKVLEERCNEINAFEKGLIHDHTIYFKFYLHISHGEQIKRLEERKTNPTKNWKYQKQDVRDISKHTTFKSAYEFIIKNCSENVNWQIIPADKKWFKNYCILKTIVEHLNTYEIKYPKLEK